MLDLSLWIPDLLNDVFVAGLPGLVPVYQQWSVVTFSSVCACFGLPLPCLLLVLSVSRIFFSKLLNAHLYHFISANSVSSLREPYSLYWCKFLINALTFVAKWHVTLLVICHCLKIILHKYCLQISKVYLRLNVI